MPEKPDYLRRLTYLGKEELQDGSLTRHKGEMQTLQPMETMISKSVEAFKKKNGVLREGGHTLYQLKGVIIS